MPKTYVAKKPTKQWSCPKGHTYTTALPAREVRAHCGRCPRRSATVRLTPRKGA
jgi:hypothetical protein